MCVISEGEECMLMGWGNAFFKNIVKEGDVVKFMDCEINLEGDVKMIKLKMIWLVNWNEFVLVELKDYDYMIMKKKLEEFDEFKDIVNSIIEVVTMVKGDGNLCVYNRGIVI